MDTIEAIKKIEEVFAYNLRKLRGNKTQAEVSEATDIPFRTYQSMEDGVVPKKEENRQALATYFDVPYTAFFQDPDLEPKPPMDQQKDTIERQIRLLISLGPDLLARLAALDDSEIEGLKAIIETALTPTAELKKTSARFHRKEENPKNKVKKDSSD